MSKRGSCLFGIFLLILLGSITYIGVMYAVIQLRYIALRDMAEILTGSELERPMDYEATRRKMLKKIEEKGAPVEEDSVFIEEVDDRKYHIYFSYTDTLNLFVKKIEFPFTVDVSPEE